MPFNKRVVSDEYHFESVDETTVKYPVAQPQSTVVHHHHPAPPAAANTTTSYFTRASPAYSSFSSCLKPHQRSLSRGSTSCIPAATECASNIVDIKIDDDTHCRIKPEVYQVHHHHHHEPRPTLRTVTYDTAVVKPVKRRSVSRSTLYDDGENVIDIKVEKNEADAIECTSICSRPRSSSRNRCSALNNSSTNSIVDIKVNTDQCGSETTKITRYETAPRLSRSSSFYDRKNTIDIKFETKEEEKVVCEPVCTTPAVSTYSTCTPSYRVASIPAAATCTTTTTTKNPCSSGYVVTTRERSTSPCKTTNSYVIRSTSPCAPCAPAPACKTTNSSYVIRSTSPCAPCAPAPVCVSTPTCSTSNNNYVVTTTTRERSVSPCKPVVSNCTVRETKSTCVPDRITGRSINYLVNHRESSTSPCKTFVKPCPATSSQYHNSYVVTTRERSASPCKRTTSNYVVTTRERSTSPCKPATTSYVCAPTTTSCNPCNTAASTNNYTVTTTTRERSVSPCVRRSTYVHTEPAAPCTPCPPARNNYVVTTTTRERSLSPCIKRTSCVTSEPPCNPCNTTNSYVVTSRQRSPSPCAARSNSYVIRTARRGCTPPPCVTTTTTAAPCTNNSYIVSSREATTGCDYQTYKYNYSETESSTSRRLNSLLSKSCTSLAGNKLVERPRVTFVEPPKITYVESCPPPKVHATVLETKTATYKPEPCTNSLTYVYNLANTSAASACASKSSVCKTSCASTSSSDEEEGRVVSYVKHHVDTGCNTDNTTTLAGCLVKAQPAVSPACRSVCLGTPFDGSCFGLLTEHCRIKDSFNVSFDFRTGSRDGVMLIVVDAFTNDSFFIELCDSQLKATLFVNGEPDSCWTQFPSPVLTNDSWVDVNFELTGSKLSLCVKDQHLTKYHRCNLRYPIRGDLFVAGFPSYLRLPFACRSRDFFRGEMRNFLVNHEGIKFYGTPSFIQPRLRKWY